MSNADKNKDEVLIPSTLDKQGRRIHRATLTPREDQRDKVLLAKLPAVIPVVFLPGIMGTNLKTKGKTDKAWRPPNGLWAGLAAAAQWSARGPKTRQNQLNPSGVEVDFDGPIEVGESGLSPYLAHKRGWGTVVRDSYHPLMAMLQQRLNHIARRGQFDPWWGSWGLGSPAQYGEEHDLPELGEKEIFHAARYSYDVWAGGYNWLQSNRDSAKAIKTYIENTVLAFYLEQNIPADKVIIVTHSMGGLVCRALTEIHGYDKVLGVVHGVQPATGAPTIYHHCRCGYEGPEQLVLGRNAAEVTGVVANAPGALELMPTADYYGGKPWLKVYDTGSRKPAPLDPGAGLKLALPAKGDPYTEIYMTPEWYGLVPASNTKYLDMSRTISAGTVIAGARKRYFERIGDVAQFHREISRKYHSETYAHYGADNSDDRHGWETIHWKGDPELLKLTHEIFDDKNGNYVRATTGGERVLSLKPGTGCAGDGTVAAASGAAPGQAGVKASFRHGNQGKGSQNAIKGYDHQNSCNDSRAQWAALHSIIRIAQNANWHD